MINPVSTYRVQFNKNFTFSQLHGIIPYLAQTGIKTIYASPIFEATPGSLHGYDITNPHRINPEIGTEEELVAISATLKDNNMLWIQDIVPNHMANNTLNAWLNDVLEKGSLSLFARFFDVPWTGKLYHGKIMLPFLEEPLEKVVAKGNIVLVLTVKGFALRYYDTDYPLRITSYKDILGQATGHFSSLKQMVELIEELRMIEEPNAYSQGVHELKLQLTSLMSNEAIYGDIEKCIQQVNNHPEMLTQIIADQVYLLCDWTETNERINFRRFFTVNGLICLNMHDEFVFDYYHTYIKNLLDRGIFQGLRVDHVDGLYDPTGYLERLRRLSGDETYIVVEKILEGGEDLPAYWPVAGTTGYEFLAQVNNLLTLPDSSGVFTDYYNNLIGSGTPAAEQVQEKKAFILRNYMGGELDNLLDLFSELNLVHKKVLDAVDEEKIKEAIAQFLIRCPVYRYYGNAMPLTAAEAKKVKEILTSARNSDQTLWDAIDLLEKSLLVLPGISNAEYNERALRFYQRCMQFTGPLMAKGVEDTLMYTYHRFIVHNEVGDTPEAFGSSIAAFHHQMIARQNDWPLALNATSTHDTKRGEDVRARLNILSAIPETWFAATDEWRVMNSALKTAGMPDSNDEYFIYQTLAGMYPLPGEKDDNVGCRLVEYLQKSLREGKVNSDWARPNEAYETATKNFILKLLDENHCFSASFKRFRDKIDLFGVINSLVQVVLKCTCPGVPDFYQGTQLWDLSLVDPDNRRPVNYPRLLENRARLEEIKATSSLQATAQQLWKSPFDPALKQWLIERLLQLRNSETDLLSLGSYLPLATSGTFSGNIFAFAREYNEKMVLVVLPLHIAGICHSPGELATLNWADTTLMLPGQQKSSFLNILDGKNTVAQGHILVKELFGNLPVAVLKRADNERD